MINRNQQLTEDSGAVTTNDPIVVLLFHLMNEHVSPKTMEDIVQTRILPVGRTNNFTNGYLARYAQNIANLLRENKEL